MKWILIILGVVVYFAIGSAAIGFLTSVSDEFDGEGVEAFCIIFWPLVLPLSLIILMCIKIYDFFSML